MKLISTSFMLVCLFSIVATAYSQVPPSVANDLQAREGKLTAQELHYNVQFEHIVFPLQASDRAGMKSDFVNVYKDRLAGGASVENMKAEINQQVDAWAKTQRRTYENEYLFYCEPERVVAQATVFAAPPSAMKKQVVEFYDKDKLAAYAACFSVPDGKRIQSSPMTVIATSDYSFRHSNPNVNRLYLDPVDLVLFAGRNPLSVYDASWHEVRKNDKEIVLSAQVKDDTMAPFSVQQTLDLTHGSLPKEVIITGGGWSKRYQVTDFTQENSCWIASDATTIQESRNNYRITRHWKFTKSNPSTLNSQLQTIKDGWPTYDYRLGKPNLSTGAINNIDNKFKQGSVTSERIFYPWDGKFPETNGLENKGKDKGLNLEQSNPINRFLVSLMCVIMLVLGISWIFNTKKQKAAVS